MNNYIHTKLSHEISYTFRIHFNTLFKTLLKFRAEIFHIIVQLHNKEYAIIYDNGLLIDKVYQSVSTFHLINYHQRSLCVNWV